MLRREAEKLRNKWSTDGSKNKTPANQQNNFKADALRMPVYMSEGLTAKILRVMDC